MTPLGGLRADLTRFVEGLDDELRHVAGKAAKEAALDAASRDLGADRAFSGFGRRNARLDAGYDITDAGVQLNLRPKGLWMLANDGRRAGPARVYPRKRARGRGAKALRTPWGPRASVQSSSSRGLGTLADAEKAIETDTFRAVDRAVTERIRRGL